jgi:hypothetical protein
MENEEKENLLPAIIVDKVTLFKYIKFPLSTDTLYIYTKDKKVLFDYPTDLSAPICYDIVFRLNLALEDVFKNEQIYPFVLKSVLKCSIVDDCIVDLNKTPFLRIRGWGWMQYVKEVNSENLQEIIINFALNVLNSVKYGSNDKQIDI